ncbi:MAG: hypothetical protein QXG05_07405 [Nitrososphaerota archaeon]
MTGNSPEPTSTSSSNRELGPSKYGKELYRNVKGYRLGIARTSKPLMIMPYNRFMQRSRISKLVKQAKSVAETGVVKYQANVNSVARHRTPLHKQWERSTANNGRNYLFLDSYSSKRALIFGNREPNVEIADCTKLLYPPYFTV